MYFLSRRVKAEVPVVRPSTPVSRRRARNAAFQSTLANSFLFEKKKLFSTPRKYASVLLCGHLDFELAVTAQNDAIQGYFS